MRLLLPWAFTIIFASAFVVLVKLYQAKGVLSPLQKHSYNVLAIGLILFLSASLLVRYDWSRLSKCFY